MTWTIIIIIINIIKADQYHRGSKMVCHTLSTTGTATQYLARHIQYKFVLSFQLQAQICHNNILHDIRTTGLVQITTAFPRLFDFKSKQHRKRLQH